MFPLSKDCSTVGASSLPQCKAAEEPKRKQDDGQEDAQAGEAVFQDTNPAEREATIRTPPQPDSPQDSWDVTEGDHTTYRHLPDTRGNVLGTGSQPHTSEPA